MDTASLRIKFSPLLKKIKDHRDPDSKCCIEIRPELSAIKNLQKLHWKLQGNFIEYTIPMTYKILIKKQDQTKSKTENKVYHSCVDLLHTYSISKTNFESGDDVTRITSENFFLKRNYENDFVVVKDMINTKGLLTDIIPQRSMNIQTLNTYEEDITSMQSLVDKALGVELYDSFESYGKSDVVFDKLILKKDRGTSHSILYKDYKSDPNSIRDTDPVPAINVHVQETDTARHSARHSRLTPSPICSVNTYDMFPIGIIDRKSNMTGYSVYANKTYATSVNTAVESNTNVSNVKKNLVKNINYDRNVCHVQTQTKIIKNVKIKNDAIKTTEPNYSPSSKDITTSLNKITKMCNKINKRKNVTDNLLEPQNNVRITKVNIIDLANKKLKIRNKTLNDQILVSDIENYLVFKEDKTVCNINYNNKMRVLPAVRVANFVQYLEKEIFPLKMMLHEIKTKCIMLGINYSESLPTPTTKSTICRPLLGTENIKPVENYKYNKKPLTKERCTKRSNRVVYTVFFNGE